MEQNTSRTTQFQQAIERLQSLTAPLLTAESNKAFEAKKQEFEAQLAEARWLKVPCVGVFSAGKSSLLNVFLQKQGMLPIDTMPETAVAYEIYFDTNERVELYRDGQLIGQQTLPNIKQLQTQPGDVAKVYCDSPVVRDLQNRGIVLVDMPGIGSGIETHDRAIYHYIQDGTAFVLMVDAEQGSLRAQTLSFLGELKVFEKYPAVFITKADKKPEGELADVREYIGYQVKKFSGQAATVGVLSSVNGQTADFQNYIYSLDADAMLRRKMLGQFSVIAESIKAELATRVSIRQQDITNIDEQIAAIEAEIAKAQATMPTSAEADTPEKSAQDVLADVQTALEAKASTIAEMMAAGENEEAIKSVIVSTLRTEIIRSLQVESEQYAHALGSAVQNSVKELGAIELNVNFMDQYCDMINTAMRVISMLPIGGLAARILGLIMTHLPVVKELINWFVSKSPAEVQDKARQVYLNQVPAIVESIRPEVLKLVSHNQERIAQQMQQSLVEQMGNVREGLLEKQADAQKSKERVAEEIAALEQAIQEVDTIAQSI